MRFMAFLLLVGLGFGVLYVMRSKASSRATRDAVDGAKAPMSGESPAGHAPAQPTPSDVPYAPTAPSPGEEPRRPGTTPRETGPDAPPSPLAVAGLTNTEVEALFISFVEEQARLLKRDPAVFLLEETDRLAKENRTRREYVAEILRSRAASENEGRALEAQQAADAARRRAEEERRHENLRVNMDAGWDDWLFDALRTIHARGVADYRLRSDGPPLSLKVLLDRKALRELPADGWGRPYVYTRTKTTFALRSLGADGVAQTADDLVSEGTWSKDRVAKAAAVK